MPAARAGTDTPLQRRRPHRHAAWSCHRLARAPCTRPPLWFLPCPPPTPESQPLVPRAEGQSLTAAPPVARARSASARRGARPAVTPLAQARAPSTPRAPRQADMQVPAVQAGHPDPALGPALAHGQALALVPVGRRAPVQEQRQPAKRRAPRVPHREAVADARSIPRPRKAR